MAERQRPVANEISQPAVEVDIRRPVDQLAYRPAAVRRISWGAALAGVVIALVIQLMLSLLGVGIGLSTMEPLTGATPRTETLGTTAGIWWIVSWCIALLLGGWAAGRLAGIPRRLDATLHGVLTWAFTTLILFYLLTTAVGDLIGGGFRILSNLLPSGREVTAVTPGLDLAWENIQRELNALTPQTGSAPGQPDALRETGRQDIGPAGAANQELTTLVDRYIRPIQGAMAATVDREAVINALVLRTGMTREQAEQTLQRWEQDYQRVKAELEQRGRQVAATAAKLAARASLWTVLALVLGLIVAAIGGALGTPRDFAAAVVRET